MLGISSPKFYGNDVMDCIDKVQEKKNDTVAVYIANHRKNKERASSTAIGAVFGTFQGILFGGAYGLGKAFPKLQKFFPLKWAVGKVDEWVERSKKLHPAEGLKHHMAVGILSKIGWLTLSGAVVGFAMDLYKTYSNTRVNGKISNTKQGAADDCWLLAGLNSLSCSKEGKNAIKNSIKVNDDNSITIKFKGVDREYNITRKELKEASKAYVADVDSKGKVHGYKKKYSKGDGDVLAFELALEKYRKDLKDGNIPHSADVPSYAEDVLKNLQSPLDGGTSNQLYYLLTGKKCSEIDMRKPVDAKVSKDLNILNMYSKSYLNKFINDYSSNPQGYAAGFNFESDAVVRNINLQKIKLKSQHVYALKHAGKHYVTIVDSHKSKENLIIPIKTFKDNLGTLWFVNLNNDTNKSELALQKYAEVNNLNQRYLNDNC